MSKTYENLLIERRIVHYPSKYYLAINQAAAQGLGLNLPPSMLEQADRVLP